MIYTNFSKKIIINVPVRNHIEFKKNSLKLFSRSPITSNVTLLLKRKSVWALRHAPSGFFRSFFGFLKPKSFISSSKFNLLAGLRINPKPYSLSQVISQTKKYTASQILNTLELLSVKSVSCVSITFLKKKTQKILPKLTQQALFRQFRHKIFSYTTPQRLTPLTTNNVDLVYTYSDIRTGFTLKPHLSSSLLNSDTVSTFN